MVAGGSCTSAASSMPFCICCTRGSSQCFCTTSEWSVSTSRFKRLFNQGMITYVGKSGKAEKMSKSKGNVVNPDELVRNTAAIHLRMYELFVGPPELDAEWSDNGIEGVYRFLKRAWHWVTMHNGKWTASPSKAMLTQRHCPRQERYRAARIVPHEHDRQLVHGVRE